MGASPSQVHRIEKGPGETRATLVAAMVMAVQGEPEDVIRLLADDTATEETGVEMARSRLGMRSEAAALTINLHPEIVNLAAQMTEFQLGKWVALGERLLGE